MSVFIKTVGEGPDLVFLHGWGLNSSVWDGLWPVLGKRYRLNCVDLPGHGLSDLETDLANLDEVCIALNSVLPRLACFVGWSLGGLVALSYALRFPLAVKRLILVASTPRFVTAGDWQQAMKTQVIEAFGESLKQDYRATLKRFLALQVQSSEEAQRTLRRLRSVLHRNPPQQRALHAGLQLLRETDLRSQLPKLQCPIRLILGERDMLVPKNCGQEIVAHLHDGRSVTLPGAGHAPFLSHPNDFLSVLQDCLEQ